VRQVVEMSDELGKEIAEVELLQGRIAKLKQLLDSTKSQQRLLAEDSSSVTENVWITTLTLKRLDGHARS
jgi:hypothetical protein